MISTRDLSGLPDIDGLRRLWKSMAMLDAILKRDWEYRLYSFNCRWSKTRPEQMGSMRNGQGDDVFALFTQKGCWLKGFAHEAAMTPYRLKRPRVFLGVLDGVPAEFTHCLEQPAFNLPDTTFCVWRRYADAAWQRGAIDFPPGDDPDGSAMLLSPLDGRPETYLERASSYFNKPWLTLDMVRHVYCHRPLTGELLAAMRPDLELDVGEPRLTVEDLEEDITEIGYPERP
jgi:hypothetical protein